jgi:hypothetical protein
MADPWILQVSDRKTRKGLIGGMYGGRMEYQGFVMVKFDRFFHSFLFCNRLEHAFFGTSM